MHTLPLQPATFSLLLHHQISSLQTPAGFTDGLARRLRPSLLCDNCVLPVREENHVSQTQNGEYGAEDGGCCYSCLDTKVLYARAVGATGRWSGCAGEGYDGRSCQWHECLRSNEGLRFTNKLAVRGHHRGKDAKRYKWVMMNVLHVWVILGLKNDMVAIEQSFRQWHNLKPCPMRTSKQEVSRRSLHETLFPVTSLLDVNGILVLKAMLQVLVPFVLEAHFCNPASVVCASTAS